VLIHIKLNIYITYENYMSLVANNLFRLCKLKSYAQSFHIPSHNLIIKAEQRTSLVMFGPKMAHPNQTKSAKLRTNYDLFKLWFWRVTGCAGHIFLWVGLFGSQLKQKQRSDDSLSSSLRSQRGKNRMLIEREDMNLIESMGLSFLHSQLFDKNRKLNGINFQRLAHYKLS